MKNLIIETDVMDYSDDCIRYVKQGLLTDPFYKNYKVDEKTIRKSIEVFNYHPLHLSLAVVDIKIHKMIGCFFAFIVDSWFANDSRDSYDLIHYIEPKYRSFKLFKQLVNKYTNWAIDNRVKNICINNTYGDIERNQKLYEFCGFKKIGNIYRLC